MIDLLVSIIVAFMILILILPIGIVVQMVVNYDCKSLENDD